MEIRIVAICVHFTRIYSSTARSICVCVFSEACQACSRFFRAPHEGRWIFFVQFI